jgi:hypothetical protein
MRESGNCSHGLSPWAGIAKQDRPCRVTAKWGAEYKHEECFPRAHNLSEAQATVIAVST